jgi:phosphate transport system substrate-binding protein
VVQGVAADRAGIGYSGIGYKTSGVRTVPLAKAEGAEFVGTDTADVLSGRYPLARFLYVYVNRAPGKPADALVREFARFMLSAEGQGIVVKDGYIPIPLDVQRVELAKLD